MLSLTDLLFIPLMCLIGNACTSTSTNGETDRWDMDAAWKELEQARGTAAGGRKKKSAKLVLSLNGGGAPAGRRR
jgi:hypothetical protein